MTLNKTWLLYFVGVAAVALAIIIPGLSWLSPLTYTVIFPIAAIWIWKNEGRSLRELGIGFNRGWVRWLGIGTAAGLAIPIFFQTVQVLGRWISLTAGEDPFEGLLAYLPILILKMVAIVAIEEFVFRGFFLQALSRKTGVWPATILASLLWGAGHLVSMVNDGLTPAAILIGMTTFLLWGITLSLGYVRAGKSLWLPYGLHLGINLSFSLVGWPFITQPLAPQWWIGNPAWSPESGLLGVVVWLILAVGMAWIAGRKRREDLARG
jgi:hypothetical protein